MLKARDTVGGVNPAPCLGLAYSTAGPSGGEILAANIMVLVGERGRGGVDPHKLYYDPFA